MITIGTSNFDQKYIHLITTKDHASSPSKGIEFDQIYQTISLALVSLSNMRLPSRTVPENMDLTL